MNCRGVDIKGNAFMLYETVNEGPVLDENAAGLSRDYVFVGLGNSSNVEIHATATVGYAKEELVSGHPNYPVYINIANRSGEEDEQADLYRQVPTIGNTECLSNYVLGGLKEVIHFKTVREDDV